MVALTWYLGGIIWAAYTYYKSPTRANLNWLLLSFIPGLNYIKTKNSILIATLGGIQIIKGIKALVNVVIMCTKINCAKYMPGIIGYAIQLYQLVIKLRSPQYYYDYYGSRVA
jgi:hypothetical protein